MIQFIEIKICEKLGCKVTDRDTFCFGIIRCIAFNNKGDKSKNLFVPNVTMDQSTKNGMIDVRKEFRDITGKTIERAAVIGSARHVSQ